MCTHFSTQNFRHWRRFYLTAGLVLLVLGLMLPTGAEAQTCPGTGGTYTADVVLFDTPMVFNRLGAQNPNWMMYALARDTVDATNLIPCTLPGANCTDLTGAEPNRVRNIALRPDKRPRPLVLRIPADSCLTVNFQNLLSPDANPLPPIQDALINDNQVASRAASFHAAGLQVVDSVADDGTYVGANTANGIAVNAGDSKIYRLYAEAEGAFLVTSHGATLGGEATGGNVGVGAFGLVAVQPVGAKIYRSQVTEEEMRLASVPISAMNPEGINYEATYPPGEPWASEGKANKPILNMMDGTAIFQSEINAIVAYKDGTGAFTDFPQSTYPLESTGKWQNPSVPNRLEPFRDFASVWHDENAAVQAFPAFFSRMPNAQGVDQNPLAHALHGVRDSFMINYGSGGIGSEIIANRLGVGPMYDCLDCAYEEFFLTSFTVGDPAMLVDVPANVGLETCNPLVAGAICDAGAIGKKATEAFFPEDPANVHHSYTGDKVKLRNVHAGPKEQHIFHLHNHQWLFNANDDNSNYLDAQGVGPGSSYTMEINYGGSGNRNKTSGDAIFHCHFYPHFAQGMWYHWRNHDVLETGTVLAVSGGTVTAPLIHATRWDLRSGLPMAGARALPDGEIVTGTPIPAVVPLPGKPLPPVPGQVTVVAKDVDGDTVADSSQASVDRTDIDANGDLKNPGFPFWVAGIEDIVGQRPPTPQLDMLPVAQAEELLGIATGQDPDTDGDTFYKGFCDDPATTTTVENCTSGFAANFVDSFVNAAGGFDGGLPRHSLDGCKAIIAQLVADGVDPINLPPGTVATGCSILDPALMAAASAGHPVFSTSVSKLDFHKEVLLSKAVFFPEEGTDVEKAAMGAHAVREHLDANMNAFILNGGPPVPGAPYNEPCIDDDGNVFYTGVTGNFFDGDLTPGNSNHGSPAADRSATAPFVYKGANIQIDAVFNKVGYHYPQQRIIALWNDILPTIDKTKAPEPFVMRLNTFDCAVYRHANLVPKEFEVDDYQVRTPTDIIGQHIHLPKWDLTTADGAANGWNYEDGTLSPGMVQERIHAINDGQGGKDGVPLAAAYPSDPDFPGNGTPVYPEWDGARVTTQRWFVDPVYNVAGDDRGLGIIFTHDHYGPSTFQQIGLYSTLLVEPARSTWKHNETGVALGTRTDGGPTSWQAAIEPTTGGADFQPFREFYFEFSDFQHAYEAGVYVGAGTDGRPFTDATFDDPHNANGTNKAFPVTADSFRNAINPSYREEAVDNGTNNPVVQPVALPDILRYPGVCPDGSLRPCPEAISADDPGMLVVNYRNEPVGLRVFDPNATGPDGKPGTQTAGFGGDLAFALATPPLLGPDAQTEIADQPLASAFRAIPQMNVQPMGGDVGVPAIPIFGTANGTTFFPPGAGEVGGINTGAIIAGDPYTPMLRAFPGDLVRIKIQTGATEHEHSTTVHGVKWLHNGSGHGAAPNSGWRNGQNEGISEQVTFAVPLNSDPQAKQPFQFDPLRGADYMYTVDASQDGYWSGMWGILRSYTGGAADLYPLPGGFTKAPQIENRRDFAGVCPKAPGAKPNDGPDPDTLRSYDVIAITANELLGNGLVASIVPGDSSATMHVGVTPDGAGGTLVYNPRGGTGANSNAQFLGPLHDPTALLFVRADDLEPLNGFKPNGQPVDAACKDGGGPNPRPGVANPPCPVKLKDDAPLEPLILRANAGDCVEVRLFNRLTDEVPDLAGYNTLLQMVIRDRQAPGNEQFNGVDVDSVTTFNNNLIRPSSYVGLHAQLAEYDITQHDGAVVGGNIAGGAVVGPTDGNTLAGAPFNAVTYRWYAGDLSAVRNGTRVNLEATPIEFGGINLSPADKIKQGQKAMIGALVIEPEGSTWPDLLASDDPAEVLTDTERDRQVADNTATRKTRADVTVDCADTDSDLTCPKGGFDDLVVVVQKGQNLRYKDGSPVENIAGEGGLIPEDSHDAGQKGVNYGSEPSWYRFGLRANAPFGNPGIGGQADAWEMYHNDRTGGEDPATPVYDVPAGAEARMRVLEPTGVGRGSTFTMHGHIWQRDPYVCPGVTTDGLLGKCPNVPLLTMGEDVGKSSPSIGKNPIGMIMGGQESVSPSQHFDIRLENTGGANGKAGDYLFRDQASFGNTDGIWGLMRVAPPAP